MWKHTWKLGHLNALHALHVPNSKNRLNQNNTHCTTNSKNFTAVVHSPANLVFTISVTWTKHGEIVILTLLFGSKTQIFCAGWQAGLLMTSKRIATHDKLYSILIGRSFPGRVTSWTWNEVLQDVVKIFYGPNIHVYVSFWNSIRQTQCYQQLKLLNM